MVISSVWITLLLPTKPYISQSRHDSAQDSLASGEDNQFVRENAGWSRSLRATSTGLSPSDAWSVATAWRALRPVVKRIEKEKLLISVKYILYIPAVAFPAEAGPHIPTPDGLKNELA